MRAWFVYYFTKFADLGANIGMHSIILGLLGAKVKATINNVEDFKLGAGTAGVAAVVVLALLIVIF